MKNILKVFIRDLKIIVKNPAALIIALGLCILPSLYAWINIKACWNPYANTGNLPVAIVNKDSGTVFNGKRINAGDEIVKTLKKNKSIGWVFIDEWQGNYGLNEGKYYALIEIPSNFSGGLSSLATATPEKPYIIYRVNEKSNAIATKITDVAKDQFAKSVKSKFVDTVNNVALKFMNSEGNKLKLNKPQILELKDIVSESDKNIDSAKKCISESNSSASGVQNYLNNFKNTLPKLTDQINSLEKIADASKSLTETTRETVNEISSEMNTDIIKMQSDNENIQIILSKVKEINNSTDTTDIVNQIDNAVSMNNSLQSAIDSDISKLQGIQEYIKNGDINSLIDALNTYKTLLSNISSQLQSLKSAISNGSSKDEINSEVDKLSSLSSTISNEVSSASNSFYSNVVPSLNSMSDNLETGFDSEESLLEAAKVVVPQLTALSNLGIQESKLSVKQANELSDRLSKLQDKIGILDDKMKNLNEKDIDNIINLMEMNPDEVADFISSPLKVKEEDVYDGGVFGVGLTPFYTVLAIWVGALLLAALLTVECKEFDDGTRLSYAEKHFGKMMIFLFISFIQTLIVTIGDKYVLGVHPANMKLLIVLALICSVTFTVIIFTLVSIFGNVGKAIAVVIMVFQIAGAGGIYPIQTNPEIFGKLAPLWPFTYAIDAFREAVAGPEWSNVIKNVRALLIFLVIYLCLFFIKKPFHKVTEIMEDKFKEAGL